MDKNAIKKYAVWARRELIERVSQRALVYGITAKDAGDPNAESVNGHLLSQAEKRQRQALIRNVKAKGYEQVCEEVAYKWFNRFAALRFMEVNGYLPSHIRVFTNDAGEFKPQILTEAIHLELDGLDMNKVYALEEANKTEELFKYLLIVQCNALNSILPGMFQRIEDYTELLLPDYLLREGSVIEQMVTTIPEEDWTDQVQIIGWLYQYYNTEPKDKVFADLKKNIKITKENIPAATQLFTPDWIVHYMVENSLGRLWLEGHPNDALKSEWKYYLDEAEQEPEVQAQLAEIRKEYAALKPEEIRVIDPCMGSGHILCVLFDVLVRIYEDYGYTAREAAVRIVENNLWGLDIDERAAQLSYFAVMMKARQYDRRFFTRNVQPHVYAIEESNNLDPHCIEYFVDGRQDLKTAMDVLVKELHDAKEYGSILNVTLVDFSALYARFDEIRNESVLNIYSYHAIDMVFPLVQVAQALAQKYHVVVTNPPYMGATGMDVKLTQYTKSKYEDACTDMSTVFMKKTLDMAIDYGYMAMINIPVWMFLASYTKLREEILKNYLIINMAHCGRGIFGSDFGTTTFVIQKNKVRSYIGTYCRLFEKQGGVDSPEKKEEYFFINKRYYTPQHYFFDIPTAPVAYWASNKLFDVYRNNPTFGEVYEIKKGSDTGGNDTYVRFWYEVDVNKIAFSEHNKKWIPYLKGGERRNWFGNIVHIVNWESDGKEIRNNPKATIRNQKYFYRDGITWSDVGISGSSFRYFPRDYLRDNRGPAIFAKDNNYLYPLAFLCSKLCTYLQGIVNPTICFQVGSAKTLPFVNVEGATRSIIEDLAKENISISQVDWNSFEISWEYDAHPFIMTKHYDITKTKTIKQAFESWKEYADSRFYQLKKNEEQINYFFIDLYGLKEALDPELEDEDITVRRVDLRREILSFISYAVGCMFGRYSLSAKGLVYAGGDFDAVYRKAVLADEHENRITFGGVGINVSHDYTQVNSAGNWVDVAFSPDRDNIIPICDDEYFEDDIVGRFVKFVEVAFGKETLEENLRFIADALGGKGSSREVIRNYFINDFYADHLKVYQKRPIYWLFDSGKKNGFKCLIYMHRYREDTIARIRTDYVHEQQSRYRTAIADLEQRINGASTSERVKLSKQMTKLQDQAEELRFYEEKIHHLADQMIKIDLDDGVKVNYAKFQDVLAKIK